MAVLKDFQRHGNTDWFYLILNFVLAIIVSFFGCVYNEFIILFCCGLERDTHSQISERANTSLAMELIKVDDEEGNNIQLNDLDSLVNDQ